jgi:hypothetical protein
MSDRVPLDFLRVLRSGHCPFRFSVFIASLVTPVELGFDRVDLLLLVGFAFAFVMNEHWATVPILPLWNLAVEIKPTLLELGGGPLAIR